MRRLLLSAVLGLVSLVFGMPAWAVTHATVTVDSATAGVELVANVTTWARVFVNPTATQDVWIGVYDTTTTCSSLTTPGVGFGELYPARTGWVYFRSQIGPDKRLCAILPAAGSETVGVAYE